MSKKWTPKHLKNFQAAMAARRKAKEKVKKGAAPIAAAKTQPDTRRKDALVYLRHASTAIHLAIRKGRLKEMDRAHLLTLLALRELDEE